MFYTDEQLSMILSTAAPMCVKRKEDDEVYYYCERFISGVIGRWIDFMTPIQLLRELEKAGLA